jgi:hypothetical protein
MHPTIEYEIAKALIAGWQRQAGQAATARAVSRALAHRHPRPATRMARRVLTLLAARGRAARAHDRPRSACPSPASCASCA